MDWLQRFSFATQKNTDFRGCLKSLQLHFGLRFKRF